MPLRNWLFRISDIQAAISAVEKYTAGMTYEDFINPSLRNRPK